MPIFLPKYDANDDNTPLLYLLPKNGRKPQRLYMVKVEKNTEGNSSNKPPILIPIVPNWPEYTRRRRISTSDDDREDEEQTVEDVVSPEPQEDPTPPTSPLSLNEPEDSVPEEDISENDSPSSSLRNSDSSPPPPPPPPENKTENDVYGGLSDKLYDEVVEYLKSGIVPETENSSEFALLKKSSYALAEDGKTLQFLHIANKDEPPKVKTVVKKGEVHGVIQKIHELIDHLGQDRTIKAVSKKLYWPTLRQDIKTFIQNCAVCNQKKADRKVHLPASVDITSDSLIIVEVRDGLRASTEGRLRISLDPSAIANESLPKAPTRAEKTKEDKNKTPPQKAVQSKSERKKSFRSVTVKGKVEIEKKPVSPPSGGWIKLSSKKRLNVDKLNLGENDEKKEEDKSSRNRKRGFSVPSVSTSQKKILSKEEITGDDVPSKIRSRLPSKRPKNIILKEDIDGPSTSKSPTQEPKLVFPNEEMREDDWQSASKKQPTKPKRIKLEMKEEEVMQVDETPSTSPGSFSGLLVPQEEIVEEDTPSPTHLGHTPPHNWVEYEYGGFSDELYANVVKYVKTGDLEESVVAAVTHQLKNHYSLSDDGETLLFTNTLRKDQTQRTKVVVRKGETQAVIQRVHELIGHLGQGRTIKAVSKHLHWLTLRDDVKAYVWNCAFCNQKKEEKKHVQRAPVNLDSHSLFNVEVRIGRAVGDRLHITLDPSAVANEKGKMNKHLVIKEEVANLELHVESKGANKSINSGNTSTQQRKRPGKENEPPRKRILASVDKQEANAVPLKKRRIGLKPESVSK